MRDMIMHDKIVRVKIMHDRIGLDMILNDKIMRQKYHSIQCLTILVYFVC